jgi:SH3-like domain-containing protein
MKSTDRSGMIRNFLLALALLLPVSAFSQALEPSANGVLGADGVLRGPETNLPLPRYVSLKASEANVRRGPSLSHRIDWVFMREDMPLRVIGEYGHWRRVIDNEGIGGWIHYSLISGHRTVMIAKEDTKILSRPESGAPETALLETGVVAELKQCNTNWCLIEADGHDGWAPKEALWGVDPQEIYN